MIVCMFVIAHAKCARFLYIFVAIAVEIKTQIVDARLLASAAA